MRSPRRSTRLAEFADRVRTSRRRFDELDEALAEHGVTEISGALFDLGVSSPQLDRPERGFSYRNDGPIDMRMNDDQQWSGHDVVNGYDRDELARVIKTHGDERFARRIADAIVAARPIETTTQLAEIVTTAIPAAARRTGGHPAKRTFQAIRIEVNAELDVLPDALDQAVAATVPGGRVAVLSYHSGEDRIAKQRFARRSGRLRLPARPAVCLRRDPDRARRAWCAQAGVGSTNRRATAARPARSCASSRRPNRCRRPPADGGGCSSRCSERAGHRIAAHTAAGAPRRQLAARVGLPWPAASCFVAVMAAMLGAAVFHTQLAERQLEIDQLERQVQEERARFDELRRDRAVLRSPQRIADEAGALGMVPGETSRFIQVDPMQLAMQLAAAGVTSDDTSRVIVETGPLDQFRDVKSVSVGQP